MNPLSEIMHFANILSHCIGCLFVLWIISLAVQLLSLMESHLFICVDILNYVSFRGLLNVRGGGCQFRQRSEAQGEDRAGDKI